MRIARFEPSLAGTVAIELRRFRAMHFPEAEAIRGYFRNVVTTCLKPDQVPRPDGRAGLPTQVCIAGQAVGKAGFRLRSPWTGTERTLRSPVFV